MLPNTQLFPYTSFPPLGAIKAIIRRKDLEVQNRSVACTSIETLYNVIIAIDKLQYDTCDLCQNWNAWSAYCFTSSRFLMLINVQLFLRKFFPPLSAYKAILRRKDYSVKQPSLRFRSMLVGAIFEYKPPTSPLHVLPNTQFFPYKSFPPLSAIKANLTRKNHRTRKPLLQLRRIPEGAAFGCKPLDTLHVLYDGTLAQFAEDLAYAYTMRNINNLFAKELREEIMYTQ